MYEMPRYTVITNANKPNQIKLGCANVNNHMPVTRLRNEIIPEMYKKVLLEFR
jgi:hypothetical protein